MMSKTLHSIFRLLIALVGAGIGAAITAGVDQVYQMTTPDANSTMATMIFAYTGMCILFAVLFYLMSNGIMLRAEKVAVLIIQKIENMPMGQLISALTGMIVGLIIAALATNILHFLGGSIFTTAISAIMFITLGVIGYTIGSRRSKEFVELFHQVTGINNRSFRTDRRTLHHKKKTLPVKIVDSTALIDGRILDIRKTGFLDGMLYIPRFVQEDLAMVSTLDDPAKSVKGKRGLEILEKLKQTDKIHIISIPEITGNDLQEKLIRTALKLETPIVTADAAIQKAA